MKKEEYICILTVSRDREADLVRMALESNGIECLISKDDCGGMKPCLQFTTGIRVMVPETDAEAAKAILEQLGEEEKE